MTLSVKTRVSVKLDNKKYKGTITYVGNSYAYCVKLDKDNLPYFVNQKDCKKLIKKKVNKNG